MKPAVFFWNNRRKNSKNNEMKSLKVSEDNLFLFLILNTLYLFFYIFLKKRKSSFEFLVGFLLS